MDTGKVTLFLGGIEVELPIPVTGATPADIAASAADQVRAYLDAGFSADAGVSVKTALIGVVVRRAKFEDGVQTPIIDMYRVDEVGNKRFLRVYLNNTADISAFEAASGLQLTALSIYEGTAPLQLDDAAQKHLVTKYAAKIDPPMKIEWRDNPKYAGVEDKKNPARVFVRYPERAAAEKGADAAAEVVVMITEVRILKDDQGKWVVRVTTADGAITLPARVIKDWSMHESAKEELRKKQVISVPLQAVFKRSVLVDVCEPEEF